MRLQERISLNPEIWSIEKVFSPHQNVLAVEDCSNSEVTELPPIIQGHPKDSETPARLAEEHGYRS